MIIRPETAADYAAIADINARAFGNRAVEATIVALLRQRPQFDRELSLVAELNDRVAGHALFSPYRIRLLDEDIPAVTLAPIAVAPEMQRRGIGASLIAEGHRLAAARGYLVSVLIGHASYYPRFGYRTHAYGCGSASVRADQLPHATLEERVPTPDDVAALHALWRRDQAAVDFALDPGDHFTAWISPNPQVRSAVYLDDGTIVGYTRIHAAHLHEPRVFWARDGGVALRMAGVIARQAPDDAAKLALPIHPSSISATAFPAAQVEPWRAAMACPLGPSRLDEYFRLVQEGKRPAGAVTWPVEFDLS